jgi:hypothetical protein
VLLGTPLWIVKRAAQSNGIKGRRDGRRGNMVDLRGGSGGGSVIESSVRWWR